MKTVFDFNDYREACKFLQDKYDAVGFERKDYYHETGEDKHLTKTSKIGHGNEGLQYHHICEDLVPSLSSIEVATKYWSEHPEYQAAENMCYCNLLEHAWLHILITENNTYASDEDQEDITGDGGVKWMMLALNSIICNADMSWYSSKNEDGKGCNYNINNIITDNYDLYIKVINRYCTSAFIRQRLNKTAEELAKDICMTCKKDGTISGGVLDIYSVILAEAKKTFLFDWNVNAYADLETYLRTGQSALVYICTGGGKTTTGLEYLRVHNVNALVLGPGNTISDSWTNKDTDSDGCPTTAADWQNEHTTYMNYQSFMNSYATLNWAKYQVVICDEAHHVKAERWGEGIRWLLTNTDIKVIGLTATPTKEQFDGVDKEFEGHICYGLDLATGIKNGLIHAFNYVQSIYKMEDVKEDFEKYGATGTQLWERLNIKLNENPIQTILKKHMPSGQRKIIVFCSNIKDIDYAKDIMTKYDSALEIRVITSKEDAENNANAKTWFNKEMTKDVCLITVSMVNEGAHYEGVNTLVMFRRTNSATLYLQQLGRIVVTTKKPNPNGIVFDFTNNAQNLIYNSTVTIEEATTKSEVKTEDEKRDTIKKVTEAIRSLAGKEVIYKDYTEDCVKTLATLMEAKDTKRQNAVIYVSFRDAQKELLDFTDDFFDFSIWSGLKTSDGNITITRPTHATSKATREHFDEVVGKGTGTVRTTVKASDTEKLAAAFKVAVRRLYNFGYMTFSDTHDCTAMITEDTQAKLITSQLGFYKYDLFKTVLDKLSKHAFIIATNID